MFITLVLTVAFSFSAAGCHLTLLITKKLLLEKCLASGSFLVVLGRGPFFGWGKRVEHVICFFCLFEISVPLAYVKYMACPYLINTHFWSFMGLGVIFWWDRKWVGQVNFFGIFEISFLLAFQQYITPKYLMNIHYFCSFWDHFWAWQGVGGTFFLFWF